VQRIDEDYSYLKVLRVGVGDHQAAVMFQLRNWQGYTSQEDELEDTDGMRLLDSSPGYVCEKEIVRSDAIFSTCSGADSEMMASAGKFDLIVIDEAEQQQNLDQ
jgi:AAA domain